MTRLYFFGPYAAKCNGRKWFQCSMSLDVFWGTFQALFIQFDGTLTAIIGCVVGKFFGILWRYHSGTDRVCVVFEKIYESTAQKFSRVSPLPMTNADLPPQRLTDLPKLPKPPPLRKAASLDTILVSNSATFHQNHPPRNSFIYIPYLFPEQRSHLLLLDLTSTLVTSLTTRIHIFLLTLLPTESNFPAPNKYYLLMILVDIVSLLTLCVTYKVRRRPRGTHCCHYVLTTPSPQAGVSGSKLVEFAFCNDVKFWVICSAAITMFVYSVGEPHHGFVF